MASLFLKYCQKLNVYLFQVWTLKLLKVWPSRGQPVTVSYLLATCSPLLIIRSDFIWTPLTASIYTSEMHLPLKAFEKSTDCAVRLKLLAHAIPLLK